MLARLRANGPNGAEWCARFCSIWENASPRHFSLPQLYSEQDGVSMFSRDCTLAPSQTGRGVGGNLGCQRGAPHVAQDSEVRRCPGGPGQTTLYPQLQLNPASFDYSVYNSFQLLCDFVSINYLEVYFLFSKMGKFLVFIIHFYLNWLSCGHSDVV